MTLRDYLHFHRIKAKTFADLVGIAPSHVSMLANSQALPSLTLALKIELHSQGQVTPKDWGVQLDEQ